jgi:hypothetical protein
MLRFLKNRRTTPQGNRSTSIGKSGSWSEKLLVHHSTTRGRQLARWAGHLVGPFCRTAAPGGRGLRRKRQKWPFSQSLTQNKPGLKKFHDLTLFHGARPHGAGALPLGAMVFSSVARRARICYVWRHCLGRHGSRVKLSSPCIAPSFSALNRRRSSQLSAPPPPPPLLLLSAPPLPPSISRRCAAPLPRISSRSAGDATALPRISSRCRCRRGVHAMEVGWGLPRLARLGPLFSPGIGPRLAPVSSPLHWCCHRPGKGSSLSSFLFLWWNCSYIGPILDECSYNYACSSICG